MQNTFTRGRDSHTFLEVKVELVALPWISMLWTLLNVCRGRSLFEQARQGGAGSPFLLLIILIALEAWQDSH